jgi:hypothetical protein
MNDIDTDAKALRRWLFHDALPLWWEVGAHRGRGAFHEAIDLEGRPLARPHRARSIARRRSSPFWNEREYSFWVDIPSARKICRSIGLLKDQQMKGAITA